MNCVAWSGRYGHIAHDNLVLQRHPQGEIVLTMGHNTALFVRERERKKRIFTLTGVLEDPYKVVDH